MLRVSHMQGLVLLRQPPNCGSKGHGGTGGGEGSARLPLEEVWILSFLCLSYTFFALFLFFSKSSAQTTAAEPQAAFIALCIKKRCRFYSRA